MKFKRNAQGVMVACVFWLSAQSALSNGPVAKNNSKTLRSPSQSVFSARSLPCSSFVQDALIGWKTLERWENAGIDLDGSNFYRSPTQEIGIWIQAKVFPNKVIELLRISEANQVSLKWDVSTCKPQLVAKEFAVVAPADGMGAFRDQDLRAALRGKKSGLVYIWSPYMPYSLRGLPEAKKLAQAKGLDFIVACDPAARSGAKKDAIKKNSWPKEYARTLRSVDLMMRGMSIHYPALIVYKNHGFVSPMLPGYEAPEMLERFVDRYLN